MATLTALTHEELAPKPSAHPRGTQRFLAGVELFRKLTAPEIEKVASASTCYRAGRGQILYCEGELLHHVYLVQSGSVKLIRYSEEGKELIVGLVGPGGCFGPMARPLIAPSLAQALAESIIQTLPLKLVRSVVANNPSFALDLLEVTERQSVDAQAAAARLAFETVPRRLATLLLALSSLRYGTLNFPLNQTEIANMIGSSRETVCSILNHLRRDGILSIVKGRIRVLDRERLAAVR